MHVRRSTYHTSTSTSARQSQEPESREVQHTRTQEDAAIPKQARCGPPLDDHGRSKRVRRMLEDQLETAARASSGPPPSPGVGSSSSAREMDPGAQQLKEMAEQTWTKEDAMAALEQGVQSGQRTFAFEGRTYTLNFTAERTDKELGYRVRITSPEVEGTAVAFLMNVMSLEFDATAKSPSAEVPSIPAAHTAFGHLRVENPFLTEALLATGAHPDDSHPVDADLRQNLIGALREKWQNDANDWHYDAGEFEGATSLKVNNADYRVTYQHQPNGEVNYLSFTVTGVMSPAMQLGERKKIEPQDRPDVVGVLAGRNKWQVRIGNSRHGMFSSWWEAVRKAESVRDETDPDRHGTTWKPPFTVRGVSFAQGHVWRINCTYQGRRYTTTRAFDPNNARLKADAWDKAVKVLGAIADGGHMEEKQE